MCEQLWEHWWALLDSLKCPCVSYTRIHAHSAGPKADSKTRVKGPARRLHYDFVIA